MITTTTHIIELSHAEIVSIIQQSLVDKFPTTTPVDPNKIKIETSSWTEDGSTISLTATIQTQDEN